MSAWPSTGDYRPLLSFFSDLDVGALFLELGTPRAGEIEVLGELPRRLRIGVGVVNQKRDPWRAGMRCCGALVGRSKSSAPSACS